MRHEHHITVNGDPFQWRGFCTKIGIKPLMIELNNFNIQLMCAVPDTYLVQEKEDSIEPLAQDIAAAGFNILRIKHEVEAPHNVDISTHSTPVLYYECHVKFDGKFQPQFPMTSRDLFRVLPGNVGRWYATKRSSSPFDPESFVEYIDRLNGSRAHFDSYEYEACILDTNPGLDAGWK